MTHPGPLPPDDPATIAALRNLFGLGETEAAQLLTSFRSPAGGARITAELAEQAHKAHANMRDLCHRLCAPERQPHGFVGQGDVLWKVMETSMAIQRHEVINSLLRYLEETPVESLSVAGCQAHVWALLRGTQKENPRGF